jgi:glycerate 2-kinase
VEIVSGEAARLSLRRDMALIRDAALKAVDPFAAVLRHLHLEGGLLRAGTATLPLTVPAARSPRRVFVLAVGKAAVPMTAAACRILGETPVEGVVVTKYGHAASYRLPSSLEVVEAGHPVPDAAGVRGGTAFLRCLNQTTADDLVLLLLSGGGSALLPAPSAGVTLEDLQVTTDCLLRSGANIVDLNIVRKHLSSLKGGQLARMAAPAPVVALVLSDVVGDPMDVIASGPTAPDPTTFAQAWDVVERYSLTDSVPKSVSAHLHSGLRGEVSETPKPGDRLFDRVHNVIVGSNALAAQAAVAQAETLGYTGLLLTTFIEGEAREIAKVSVALAKSLKATGHPVSPPACLVWGGETTVTVTGQGKGGRNQELALAAALGLEGIAGVAVMALATDGTDGPTDAAGAVVDGSTGARARGRGWDLRAALQDNNAYPLLDDVGDLLLLGPTGTNVNDILVLLAL